MSILLRQALAYRKRGTVGMLRRLIVTGALFLLAGALAGSAGASQLIDRSASNIKLAVNKNGLALMTYRAKGKIHHTLAWGAINALPPTKGRYQVKFSLDYSGGWGTFRRDVWKTMKNVCGPYQGPQLAWMVAACTMPDGSHWALQSWQRMLPNVGLPPRTAEQRAWELRLSHWNTDLALLDIHLDWAYRKYDHLWGNYSYLGNPVHGFRVTRTGAPLDSWGRNIYVDTYNSAYGPGWKRENSFLAHNPSGDFCYGFYPGQNNSNRPAGTGEYYRATAIGPGVTPDVFWQSAAPGPYNAELDQQANELQREYFADDGLCKPN
jgi:hypothetical protein